MFSFRNKHWRRVAKCLTGCAALLLTALFPGAPARAELDPAATRSSEEPPLLKFQYRLFPAVEVDTLRVTQNGKPLEYRHTPFAHNPLNTAALLVLVETSVGSTRAPRDQTLEENKRLIQALLAQAGPSLSVGVCAFASDLVEIAPLGAPFGEIQNRIARLKADGQGERLYRQGMQAIEKLAAAPATRRALLILSDGKDEDNGFARENLLKAALQAHVTLFAMGCPETGADIPFLGNLEKLATETRGLYAQARIGTPGPGERLKTDAAFVRDVLASLSSGGEVTVPLDALAGVGDVAFEIVARGGEIFRHVHARAGHPESRAVPAAPSPMPVPVPAPALAPAPLPAALPSASPLSPPPRLPDSSSFSQGWLTPANLISAGSALLLALAVLILRRRHKPHATPPSAVSTAYAYLQMQDAESKRIPLAKPANRIGRRPENDVVFTNTSVSGYHAEIHVQRDGAFRITDLGSGNGLRVNGQPLAQAALKDGDLVELGEVRFRFYRG
ncbi:MAG: FHA domain-containing protein [Verrucomicrobiota bacterium]